jgi:hypothetical protein
MRENREVKAFLLTWNCYGTWLHGDERGSVDAEHHFPGQPRAPFNPVRETVRSQQMKCSPYYLGPKERGVVHRTIREVCWHRSWPLLELNVRTNHVHVVLSCPVRPDKAVADLKAWCTRRLREAALLGKQQPAWAEGVSTIWLWTDAQVENKCAYVREGQGDDLPME